MVQEIKGNIIAFKKDGTMVVFDSKEEQVKYDFRANNLSMIFASPRWILNHIKEADEKIEELEKELDKNE